MRLPFSAAMVASSRLILLLPWAAPSSSFLSSAAPLPSVSAYRERHAASAAAAATATQENTNPAAAAVPPGPPQGEDQTHRSLWHDWPDAVCLPDQMGTSVNATYSTNEDSYTPAQCNGVHCRHFHAEPASSDECPNGGFYMDILLGGDGRHVHVTSCRDDEKLDFTLEPGTGGGPDHLTDAERAFMIKTADKIEVDNDEYMDNVEALALQAVRAARILADWPEDLEIAYVLDPQEQRDNIREYELEDPDKLHTDPPGTRERTRRLALLSSSSMSAKKKGSAPDERKQQRRRLDHELDPPLFTDMCPEIYEFLHPIGYSSDEFSAQVGPLLWCLNMTGHEGMQIYDWTQEDETDEDRWSCQSREHLLDEGCCYPPRIDFALGDCFGRCGGPGCRDGSSGGGLRTLGSYTLDCADLDFCRLFRVGTDQMDDDGDGHLESTCHLRFRNAIDDWMWSYHCDPVHQCPVEPSDCEYERMTLLDLWEMEGGGDLISPAGGQTGAIPEPKPDMTPIVPQAPFVDPDDYVVGMGKPEPATSAEDDDDDDGHGDMDDWSENYLPDGGFEKYDKPKDSPWKKYGNGGYSITQTGRRAHSTWSAVVKDGGAEQIDLDMSGKIPAGSTVRVRGYSKSKDASATLQPGDYCISVEVTFVDGGGGEMMEQVFDFDATKTNVDWTKGVVEFDVPHDVSTVSVYALYKNDPNSKPKGQGGKNSMAWFDDFECRVKEFVRV